jgi:hypothetical protein
MSPSPRGRRSNAELGGRRQLLISKDGNIPEKGLRLLIDEARKANKLDREVSINKVADSSILKEVQRDLGIRQGKSPRIQ